MIGEYRVTGFLGEGGMGEVYRGVHEKLGRHAAIKILHSHTADESFKTRFFNEARLQAGLQHPNIATLYDYREDGGQLFIFMELVDGESLSDLIERGPFDVDEALRVFASICEAVAYIHGNGIIHRDIKAENVKMTSGGGAKLLDFGIAQDSASHGLTQTGGVIGTPNYLSPEQLEGRPATTQADIWALGVLLYTMVTGSAPFKGNSVGELVLKITTAEFVPPHTVNKAVPDKVESIIRKCLQKKPADRYESVNDLLKAIRQPADPTAVMNVSGGGTAGLDIETETVVRERMPLTEVQYSQATAEKAIPLTEVNYASPTREPTTEKAIPAAKSFPYALFIGGSGGVLLLAIVGISVAAYMMTRENAAQPPVKDVQNLFSKNSPSQNASGKSSSAVNGTAPNGLPGKGNNQIRIDVDEGKAQVLRNGQVLGSTPYDMDANIGDTLNLVLRREGYTDKPVNIEVTSGKRVFTFSLKGK